MSIREQLDALSKKIEKAYELKRDLVQDYAYSIYFELREIKKYVDMFSPEGELFSKVNSEYESLKDDFSLETPRSYSEIMDDERKMMGYSDPDDESDW